MWQQGRWASWFSDHDTGGGSGASAATREGALRSAPPAQPSSVPGLDLKLRAAQDLGQALRGDRSLSPGQALTPTWAPGTGHRLLPHLLLCLWCNLEGLRLISRDKDQVLKEHRRSEKSYWTEYPSPPTQRFPGEVPSESV